ncbi:MAG: HAE1 family hydrophobic/amphiphilic exporter-1 [Planctomycetota bacterium]
MTESQTAGAAGKPTSWLSFVATRPVAITMFFLALAVFGGVSALNLPVDLLPEISYPTLTVRTSHPGAAPEDVEDRISERIQEALSTLPDLVRNTSISRAGYSDVLLEFGWGTNMTFAVQEVRDRLDGVFLPNDADRPLILRYDPNLDPILRVGIGPVGEQEEGFDADTLIRLRWLAENRLERELEGIEGVAAVQVRGGLTEEVLISVDPNRLAAQNIELSAIGTRLAAENLNASSGQIREGSTDYLVRTLNEFRDIEEIKGLALERRGDAVIRIADVADVTRTYAERKVITKIAGAEAVEIAIYREAGANIVKVAQEVRRMMMGSPEQQAIAKRLIAEGKTKNENLSREERQQVAFLGWQLRKDLNLEVLSDQSTFIAAAVKDVRDAAGLGAILAVLVIWVFLRQVSATFIIALAIPISVVVTFAPMLLMGVSLNIMSLGGLALGVGMLVDNAIVVLESITRCREEGDDANQAAVRGVSEVSGAIVASTLTTVAVFAPIVFVHGIAGQIFGDQAVTVVSALLVSLLVAVLFIPMLGSRPMLAGGDTGAKGYEWILDILRSVRRAPLSAPMNLVVFCGKFLYRFLLADLTPANDPMAVRVINSIMPLAGRILKLGLFWILRGALLVGGVVGIGVFLLGLLRKVTFDLAWAGLEALYPRVLRFALAVPIVVLALVGVMVWGAWGRVGNLGLELLPEIHQGEFTAFVTLDDGTPIAESNRIFSELDREVRALEAVAGTALTVGVEPDTLTREIEGDHTARLSIRMHPGQATSEDEARLEGRVRHILEGHPAVSSPPTFRRPTPFTLEAPIAVEIRGWDLAVLADVASRVKERLAAIPGLADVQTTVREGHPEAQVTFDRDKILEYGLDLGAISDYVRDQVLGRVDTRLVEGDDRIDIRVRADQKLLATVSDVASIIVNPSSDKPVHLRSLATIREVSGPAEIRRIGNSRAVLVTASSEGMDLGGVNEAIEASLAGMNYPETVSVEIGGQKRELEAGTQSLKMALLLAIFLVYVVMATQFESLVQPLVILLSVPLAGVGVVFALDYFVIPLSVVVFIGLILLAGIVVNNAIVLVDRVNQKVDEGMGQKEALVEAGHARLRPILMTTATTVLGLLPLTGWLASVPVIGAFGAGAGAELRSPMAVTVISGLITSTLLTLVVIPVIYRLVVRETRPEVAA